MHYALPEELKKDYGVTDARTACWAPPALTVRT
ncbi:hypothetical protein QFZ68_006784 [Streptomyces sp. V1I6]|nr:hypothetical protein [Streptomyces sp. V1I6]